MASAAVPGNDKQTFLRILANTIVEFKTPYFEHLEGDSDDESMDIQNTGRINEMLTNFDKLYTIVRKGIEQAAEGRGRAAPQQGGAKPIDEQAVLRVFEKRGVFSAVRTDPSLAEPMIYLLGQHLKTYPFTQSADHVQKLGSAQVEAGEESILSNKSE